MFACDCGGWEWRGHAHVEAKWWSEWWSCIRGGSQGDDNDHGVCAHDPCVDCGAGERREDVRERVRSIYIYCDDVHTMLNALHGTWKNGTMSK